MACRFTIITVCYNAEKYIEATIKSVLSQSYEHFEYIIKDGQSTDGTMDIVKALTKNDNRIKVQQGRDNGIYDAMNIAVAETTGEYILFLNAGDILHSSDILEILADYMNRVEVDVYYGNVVEINIVNTMKVCTERVYNENSIKLLQYAVGRCLCHQTMFANRRLFDNKIFDLSFQVCADKEWQLYQLTKGYKFAYVPAIVSDVLAEGYSSHHVGELERETRKCIQEYCGKYLWIYDGIMNLKKSIVIRKLLQRIDAFFAKKK